jgi:hypothetical protein
MKIWDSSVGIATRYDLDGRASISGRVSDVYTGSGALLASCTGVAGGFF